MEAGCRSADRGGRERSLFASWSLSLFIIFCFFFKSAKSDVVRSSRFVVMSVCSLTQKLKNVYTNFFAQSQGDYILEVI